MTRNRAEFSMRALLWRNSHIRPTRFQLCHVCILFERFTWLLPGCNSRTNGASCSEGRKSVFRVAARRRGGGLCQLHFGLGKSHRRNHGSARRKWKVLSVLYLFDAVLTASLADTCVFTVWSSLLLIGIVDWEGPFWIDIWRTFANLEGSKVCIFCANRSL